MQKHLTTIVLLLIGLFAQGQTTQTPDSLNQDVSPKGGLNALVVRYYGIEFSKEQRKFLKDKEIEFIFQIDEMGKPTLSEINGIDNPAIIDSLKNKTKEIEYFNPHIRDGKPVAAIYFMQLVFPTYQMTSRRFGFLQGSAYNEAKFEDFEYIRTDNSRIDVTMGGVMNQFLGKPVAYLKLGGGMKFNSSLSDKRGYIYGLNMSMYGNKRKKNYPLSTPREQFSDPPTILVGLLFGKWFNKFNVLANLSYAAQNVTERLGPDDNDWVQLKGWSPAVLVNYPIRFGKQRTSYAYGAPSILEHNLNLHFGLSYIFLSIPEASGAMLEIGVSYMMTGKRVTEYKLRDEFYKR